MKIKNILALALIGGFALTGCDYNMDNFEGLDSKVELKDVQTLEYTLTDEEWAMLFQQAVWIENFRLEGLAKVLGRLFAPTE